MDKMFRLKKYPEGWIVERKMWKRHWFWGVINRWHYVTHYLGLPDSPFYYDSPEGARDGALDIIKGDINHSFYHPQFYKD